jgi:hypothetical protein
LKALRLTARDLIAPETGQPPQQAAPTYRCDKTIEAFPTSAPTGTITNDDGLDIHLRRAPKDAAAS